MKARCICRQQWSACRHQAHAGTRRVQSEAQAGTTAGTRRVQAPDTQAPDTRTLQIARTWTLQEPGKCRQCGHHKFGHCRHKAHGSTVQERMRVDTHTHTHIQTGDFVVSSKYWIAGHESDRAGRRVGQARRTRGRQRWHHRRRDACSLCAILSVRARQVSVTAQPRSLCVILMALLSVTAPPAPCASLSQSYSHS